MLSEDDFLEDVAFDEAERRRCILRDITMRIKENGIHFAANSPKRATQFMPFAALTGFEELMAEKEADAAKFEDFAGAQVFDTPLGRGGGSVTTRGRRTPAPPSTRDACRGFSRISGKETANPVHPRCVKRVAATARCPRGAGRAVGPASSTTATRRPPQAPDVPPRARTTACYAFLQIWQSRGLTHTNVNRRKVMFKISNFTDNDDVTVLKEFGAFKTIEWKRDLSVNEASAMNAYFASEMNVRRRQVICDLSQAPVTVQAGAMQWMVGNVTCTTGVKGVGDLFGKALRGAVTSESAIKPEYQGTGLLVLEPTYRYIITLDVADWDNSIVLDDGLFLACYSSLQHKTVMRSNVSSAVAGNEGLFNLGIQGYGALCLESPCPEEELIEVTLDNDELKIDGNMALAWSGSLNFTVERSGKSLVGSAASGEGLVNVYRGTGKVLLAPTLY